MLLQEIILQVLFEGGVASVHDLERYVKDDVLRHGVRLNELEKKVLNAFSELTANDVLDDDALFAFSDGAEEDGRLKKRLEELIGDCLVIANHCEFDVVNALTLMDNVQFLQDLRVRVEPALPCLVG